MKKTGLVFIILGLILTIFTTVTYFTKEKVADIGEVHITKDKKHNLHWSPLMGLAVIGIGGVFLLVSAKR